MTTQQVIEASFAKRVRIESYQWPKPYEQDICHQTSAAEIENLIDEMKAEKRLETKL